MVKFIKQQIEKFKDKMYTKDYETGFKEAIGCYFNKEVTLNELAKYQHSMDAFDRGVCKAIRVIRSLDLPDTYS